MFYRITDNRKFANQLQGDPPIRADQNGFIEFRIKKEFNIELISHLNLIILWWRRPYFGEIIYVIFFICRDLAPKFIEFRSQISQPIQFLVHLSNLLFDHSTLGFSRYEVSLGMKQLHFHLKIERVLSGGEHFLFLNELINQFHFPSKRLNVGVIFVIFI